MCRDARAKEKTTKFILSYAKILIMLRCALLSHMYLCMSTDNALVNGELVKWFISEK